jgi:hypothetical protein
LARGGGVLDQYVHDALSAALEAADAVDVHAGLAGRLAGIGDRARDVAKNHRKIGCHRIFLRWE